MLLRSIFHVEPKSGRTHLFATQNASDNNQVDHNATEPDGNDNWLRIHPNRKKRFFEQNFVDKVFLRNP